MVSHHPLGHEPCSMQTSLIHYSGSLLALRLGPKLSGKNIMLVCLKNISVKSSFPKYLFLYSCAEPFGHWNSTAGFQLRHRRTNSGHGDSGCSHPASSVVWFHGERSIPNSEPWGEFNKHWQHRLEQCGIRVAKPARVSGRDRSRGNSGISNRIQAFVSRCS